MSTEPQALALNTSYFTLALIMQKVISFLYFTFLARLLGPELIGKYVFALSITTVFSVLLDLGLANVLTREVARNHTNAERYIRLIVGFKLIAALVVAALVVIFVTVTVYPVITRQLVYIAAIVMVLDSFTLTAYSAIRGFHNLIWESLGTVLMQITVALGGFVASFFTHDLRCFMTALVLAALVNCLFAWRQLTQRYFVKIAPRYNMADLKFLGQLAWPFALAAILTRVYGYLDTVLLSLLSGDKAVGIYSVAYKITFALQFIPAAFSATLFPSFSAYYALAPEKLSQTFMRGVIYLSAIALPVSLGIIALAPEIISTIYPSFIEAVLPLQILIFGLIFLFITFPVGALLPACNRQMRQTGNLAMAAGINLILNIILIPLWGPLGAAVASLVSTLVLLIAGWLVVSQLIKLDHKWLGYKLGRLIISAGVMFVAAMWLKKYLTFVFVIPLAGAVYISLMILLQAVSWQELRQLIKIIVRRHSA